MKKDSYGVSASGKEKSKHKARQIEEGLDYYFENNLLVFTEHFLRERGYCCGNGCRHCPYEKRIDGEHT